MKFKVESNWLLRTEEEIELNPKDFVHCATIEELNDEIKDFIHQYMKYPNMERGYCLYEEALGMEYWDTTYGNFMLEWQRLKGLPQEL
jgi:hypothetical protein